MKELDQSAFPYVLGYRDLYFFIHNLAVEPSRINSLSLSQPFPTVPRERRPTQQLQDPLGRRGGASAGPRAPCVPLGAFPAVLLLRGRQPCLRERAPCVLLLSKGSRAADPGCFLKTGLGEACPRPGCVGAGVPSRCRPQASVGLAPAASRLQPPNVPNNPRPGESAGPGRAHGSAERSCRTSRETAARPPRPVPPR